MHFKNIQLFKTIEKVDKLIYFIKCNWWTSL